MRRHVATVCQGATLEKLEGTVIASTTVSSSRSRPGAKPFDFQGAIQGRLPAFSEAADDERIDHVFESGLIDALLDARCEDIPSLLFDGLWSSEAPEKFRSLIMYRNAVHEILAVDEDTGNVTYISRGTLTKRFVKKMGIYALELAYAIAKDSVPARMPGRMRDARRLFDRLCETTDGLTLRHAMQQSTGYLKNSFACRHRLDHALSKLEDSMRARLSRCY